MILIAEVVVVECHGCCLCLLTLHNGFVMHSYAIAGHLMGMGDSAEGEWQESSVLGRTTGPHITEMTLTVEVEGVEWLGS